MKRKAKKRPGRPAAAGGRVKLTTTLAPATVKWLRVLGNGSISRAIESLVEGKLDKEGEFWEKIARLNKSWDDSMKRRPVNQTGK